MSSPQDKINIIKKKFPSKPETSYNGIAKVAIILTSYNRPKRVKRAIDSVLRQTYQDFHLYIMDNNSIDSLKDELKKKYGNNSKITLYFTNIKNEDRLLGWWLSVLINMALEWGKEEYISVLTDDEWYMPKRLEHMVKFLDTHQNTHICFCTRFDESSSCLLGANRILDNAGSQIDHCQVMWRRTSITEKDGIKWIEIFRGTPDAQFFFAIAHRGYKVYPIDTNEILERNEIPLNKKLTHMMGTKDGEKHLISGGLME